MTSAPLGGTAPPLEPPVGELLVEPTERVGPRYSTLYTAASIALWMGFNVPSQVLIAQQIELIDPANKQSQLTIVLLVGAVVSLFANPMFGAVSDATTSRFGRRRPWALTGAVGGAGSLWALSIAETVPMLTLGWALAQLTLNILLAALMAMVPDRVPVTQRGFVSALAGLAQVFGTVGGLLIVVSISGGFVAKYSAIAVLLVISVVLLVLGVGDSPAPAPRPLSLRKLVGSLWVSPVHHPDFAWAWITRFLVMLGYAVGLTFLYYFLHDAVKYEELFPGHNSDEGVLILTAVAAVGILLTIVVGGLLSDRIGRRKIFVIVSTVVIAVGLLVLAVSQTWPAALVAAALIGAGYGVYLAVDVALITEVLPSADDRGGDLGVINIANTLPQTAAPVICGFIVEHAGGYPVLFATAAAITLLGAVLIQPIKSVR